MNIIIIADPGRPGASLRHSNPGKSSAHGVPPDSAGLREMGGAPRNLAPRNHSWCGLSNHQAAAAQMGTWQAEFSLRIKQYRRVPTPLNQLYVCMYIYIYIKKKKKNKKNIYIYIYIHTHIGSTSPFSEGPESGTAEPRTYIHVHMYWYIYIYIYI